MNYRDIIRENCNHRSDVPWWPQFAFHCTDVKNAVNILSSGRLYSRTDAEKLGIMKNDNASRQVIDMTMTAAASYARFYFRPLTPTQYHNEGYKHPALRYDDDKNANMPVPVFFAFDLEKVLETPGAQFSERAQAGHGAKLFHSVEEFAALDFRKIYSNQYDENWQDTIKYRHAELLIPSQFEIDTCLSAILCRNHVELLTLRNLLQQQNPEFFNKYKDRMKICRREMFENNGLFISDCHFSENTISITFSDTYAKAKHTRSAMSKKGLTSLSPVQGRLNLRWFNAKQVLCFQTTVENSIDYIHPKAITFENLPHILDARTLRIEFYIEGALMCCLDYPLSDVELIK